MKREIASVIAAMVLAISFIIILSTLLLFKILILEDVRAEFTALIINFGIIGALVWGFKPALQLVIFGKKPKLSNQQLKGHTMELANDLNFFVLERKRQDPSYGNLTDTTKWEEYSKNIINYSSETNTFFHVKFDQRLADICEEFGLRRIVPDNKRFFELIKFPTNYFGLEDISQTLAHMAAKL
jgi:hypothetical protein